jgi:hypothetical protein
MPPYRTIPSNEEPFLFILPIPPHPTSPLPHTPHPTSHIPLPFKQDLLLFALLRGIFHRFF